MKRILSVIVIVGIMAGAVGCEAKSEALDVVSVDQLNAVIDDFNDLLAERDAEIDELRSAMITLADLHDDLDLRVQAWSDDLSAWTEEVSAWSEEVADALNVINGLK